MSKCTAWLPDSKVVKALNIVTSYAMMNPKEFTGAAPDLFIAGNDAAAKQLIASWLEEIGWGSWIWATSRRAVYWSRWR